MGGPAAVSSDGGAAYAHLIDTSQPWWKNKRLVNLNLCIGLLYVLISHLRLLTPDVWTWAD